jgi:ATP phosphoribosyltransferase
MPERHRIPVADRRTTCPPDGDSSSPAVVVAPPSSSEEHPMLRVAVPNKGTLSEPAAEMLREAGYRQRTDSRDLTVLDPSNDVEFFFLRPKDIAIYVGSGELDLGITGRDLTADSGAPVHELLGLGFGYSNFRYAAPDGRTWTVDDLQGKRIATAYQNLVLADLGRRGVSAEVIRLDGAVEISVQLGVADAIADVVGSGRTLRQHGLSAFGDVICSSEAVLIGRAGVEPGAPSRQLANRLRGIVLAQQYLMLDYDCPKALLADAVRLTPGLESPTVSPMADDNWVAVRAMVKRRESNPIMDALVELGAKAVLASDIRSCRL